MGASAKAATSSSTGIRAKIGRDGWIMRGCMVVVSLFLIVSVLLPLYSMLSKSIENKAGDFVGFANYLEYFSTPALFLSAINSLYISVIATFLVLGAAFLYGCLLYTSPSPRD